MRTFEQLDLVGADVFYCPNFFKKDLSDKINKNVKWENFLVKVRGKVFDQPRKSFYMADTNKSYRYSGYARQPEKWTTVMSNIKKLLNRVIKKIKPEHPEINAVLGNLYRTGDDYIGFHSDDERDLNPDSFIVSVTFGAERDFIFKNKETGEKTTIKLKSGSVLLMGGDCQKNYKHSLPVRKKIKKPRINLTFRSIID